mmetsp:Transcript_53050/g.130070  ORF Transcript_53050/g.130070 Transcript_53050/m.130070 type:complete len:96 (+) Transcript_53050:96-383(+)
MEDRATLRISCQYVCNWLYHGLVDEARVRATFEKMAAVVDRQNGNDPKYEPMCGNLDKSVSFAAAMALVSTGRAEQGGYTEPVLHAKRRDVKAAQ